MNTYDTHPTPAPAPVVVMESPDRETRPLGIGVSMVLAGHAALPFTPWAWLALVVGIPLVGYGIARIGR